MNTDDLAYELAQAEARFERHQHRHDALRHETDTDDAAELAMLGRSLTGGRLSAEGRRNTVERIEWLRGRCAPMRMAAE